MAEFSVVHGLVGGVLVGFAAALLFLGKGRIAGLSGIFGGIVHRRDVKWRLVFLFGLAAGGLAARMFMPAAFGAPVETSTPVILLAGLLVGYGTTVGNGCTSGHGVCGISRFSVRSLVATGTFIATGALTLVVLRAVGGGV